MIAELTSIYKGKKVFLTGHTGFKGSWLMKVLSMIGAEVRGYALAPENNNNLYNLLNGDQICDSIIADLRDKAKLNEAIDSFQPDYVFHLAAQPLVRLSYKNPVDTFEVNVIGTANVLEGVKTLSKPCRVVLITTDKVYHNNEWEYPYRESDRLGGYDPYSASKACAELVIDSYRNSFFNLDLYDAHHKSIAVGRAGNVIGGGDWANDRLIPDIVTALSKNEAVEMRNPNSVRPWQHVLEPLVGYLLLGAKMTEDPIKYSHAYNFGPYFNDALEVTKMVDLAIACWGSGQSTIKQLSNQPHEAGLLKLDISKSIKDLNWMPQFNAETAVHYTIKWYKEYFNDKNNIIQFTENQIADFLK